MEASIWASVLAIQMLQKVKWITGFWELAEDCPFIVSTHKIVVI